MTAQEDGFNVPGELEGWKTDSGGEREPLFPPPPTDPGYKAEEILEELLPENRLPSSTGPYLEQPYETLPDSYRREGRDDYDPWVSGIEMTATMPDIASRTDSTASSLEGIRPNYYFSDDEAGGAQGSDQTYLEAPTSTAILDVDALEAAAAAASDDLPTAIDGPLVLEGQEPAMREQPNTARKHRKHSRLVGDFCSYRCGIDSTAPSQATKQTADTGSIVQSPARDNIFSIASNITKGAVRQHARKQPESHASTESNRDIGQHEVEDLESIASFGDGRSKDGQPALSGSFDGKGLQDGSDERQSRATDLKRHSGLPSSENKAYSDAGDDSACMMMGETGYPGFDVWQDEDCR
ncbi:hypothetical protein NCC49_000090 [Naganishia albida]|nr:hypothetical protein NCC49_000090 [Naganishia albida]